MNYYCGARMNSLAKWLNESLLKDVVPQCLEFAENEIDDLIQDGVFKNIPVLNGIASVIRAGADLRERNLLRQTAAFLKEFSSGKIDRKKLKKYVEKMEDDKTRKKELDRVLLTLNNNIDIEKSKMLAKLFTAYINETISNELFYEYVEITNRMFMEDFRVLKEIEAGTEDNPREDDKFRVDRIYSLGIIGNSFYLMGEIYNPIQGRVLNGIGKQYCDIIFGSEDK